MKRFMLLILALALAIAPLPAFAESRTYTETVSVKVDDDDATALNKAKGRAKEKALRNYLNDVYKDRAATIDLPADEKYIQELQVVESTVSGNLSKELTAKITVTINEEEVRTYLTQQGAVVDTNEDRRVYVILLPGKIENGDATDILDNIRNEIRKNVAAADYTVIDPEELIDSDKNAKRLERMVEENDYINLIGELEGLAEWVLICKVDTNVTQSNTMRTYRTLLTGKMLSVSTGEPMWEGKIEGLAKAHANEPPRAAMAAQRMAAKSGGKSVVKDSLHGIKTKMLVLERRGTRLEMVFPSEGDLKLERLILKIIREDINGTKDVRRKNRGKGDMLVNLFFNGKIKDLMGLLQKNFEDDAQLKQWKPELEGNKIIFKK